MVDRQGAAAAASLARQLKLSLLWAEARFLLARSGGARTWALSPCQRVRTRCTLSVRQYVPPLLSQSPGGSCWNGGRRTRARCIKCMTAASDSFGESQAHASSVSSPTIRPDRPQNVRTRISFPSRKQSRIRTHRSPTLIPRHRRHRLPGHRYNSPLHLECARHVGNRPRCLPQASRQS